MEWVKSQGTRERQAPSSLQVQRLQRVPQAQPFRFFVHKPRAKPRLPGSKCIS